MKIKINYNVAKVLILLIALEILAILIKQIIIAL